MLSDTNDRAPALQLMRSTAYFPACRLPATASSCRAAPHNGRACKSTAGCRWPLPDVHKARRHCQWMAACAMPPVSHLVWEDDWLSLLSCQHILSLLLQLLHGCCACTTGCLVGADDHALHLGHLVQGGDRHQGNDGAAVGVGNDGTTTCACTSSFHINNNNTRLVHIKPRREDWKPQLATTCCACAELSWHAAAGGETCRCLHAAASALHGAPAASCYCRHGLCSHLQS